MFIILVYFINKPARVLVPNIYPSIVLYQNASRLAFENFLLMILFPNDYSALTHLTRLYPFDR